jgi:serine/threonine-protein kinase
VEGDSLRALIREARRRRAIPPEMAVKIIADAAAGLHAAHELRGWDGELRHLVHCDVSPHNILVGLDGRAKIVDFGVANARLHSDIGADERVKGKFAYMSPEQARGEKLDRRSDVFSLGIVLFELTTGERLFRGENAAHTLALVTSGKIPDPRRVRPDYPPGLARITLRALERDPARRFQSAEALRDALERFLVEERIFVSHASVAQVVRRVLGPRIEVLRQKLREALVARDGTFRADLLPEPPIPSALLLDASRVSIYSGTPHPQTYETPIPERPGLAPIFAAIGGIAAASASIVWAMHRPLPPPSAAESGGALAVAAASVANENDAQRVNKDHASGVESPSVEPTQPVTANPGFDVANLPLAAQGSGAAAGAARRSSRGASRPSRSGATSIADGANTDPARSSDATASALQSSSRAPAIELEEEASPRSPNAVRASETPSPPEKPAAPAGPFNRGAALAQLGAAASRATSCKRPGGPTGSGHATITFAPDGSVSKVAIQGPFAAAATGACLSTALSRTRVPAFSGSAVSLPLSFRIPE